MNQERREHLIKGKKIELILEQLNSLPTLPSVASRLLQITSQTDTQAKEVVELIESDQSLASKILSLTAQLSKDVNRRSTSSVSKAVVMLGFEAVRNAVLSIKVFETLSGSKDHDHQAFNRTEFWKHSLAVACASRQLIRLFDRKVEPEEAFICGLLHDMGKVALDACLPKSYARVVEMTESSLGNLSDYEQKILGIDHTIVGKRLAENWRLPQSVLETVWLHHQHPDGLPKGLEYRSIVKAVHLADVLVREQRIGYSGNHRFLDSSAQIAQVLGCSLEGVEKIARELRQEISQRAQILGLDEMHPEELYHEALCEANRELGQMNTRLGQQNRKLSVRSKYFEMLSEFGRKLRAGQTVVGVCGIIAELWQEHIGCRQCGAYRRSEKETIYEGAVKTSDQSQVSVFLVDQTDDPQLKSSSVEDNPMTGGFEVRAVGETHRWFFEQVAPTFEISETLFMPLRIGGCQVGGLLWEMAPEQADYRGQIKEMEAFAACGALAIQQAQHQEEQTSQCEQLAEGNRQLHEARQELVRKRSLAAVGEMARGAAHEINNPLAVIVGRAQLLSSSETDAKRKKTLESIWRGGQEITTIIKELMEFAKPTRPQPRRVSVQEIVSWATADRSEQAKQANVHIDVQLDEGLPDVFVDADQLSQAIGELLSNAIGSYQEENGTVRIRSRRNDFEEEVIVEISDDGCGMDVIELEKAFAPFYSGKPAGRNRGLGLSRSARHIDNNAGQLLLRSELGKGSTARVVLPVSRLSRRDEVAV